MPMGANVLTLADWAKRLDPDDTVADIIELLEEENEILEDMLWREGNLTTGHRSTQRGGLPTVAYRKLNKGIPVSKSRTIQVDDTCGTLEGYSETDKELADLNGNTAEFRMSEAAAFIEAMSQEFADNLFYGDTSSDPEKILGLSPRYSDLSADNGENIIDAGGSSNLTSIWVVAWSERTCFGIFPKGMTAGLQHEDLGEDTLRDSDNNPYQGYRDHFQWRNGLALPDWRYVVRIANIDYTAAQAGTVALDQLLIKALGKIRSKSRGRIAIYCNEEIKTALDLQGNTGTQENATAQKTPLVGIRMTEFGGMPILTFRGYPIRRCDAILNNETELT